VKSLAVGDGDMHYIRHGSDSFTIIDCCIPDDSRGVILDEVKCASRDKGIHRFISTHPDDDHIRGLCALDDATTILNFYCVSNEATKSDETDDFRRYCDLRDDRQKAFHVFEGCSRKWMNDASDERGSAGIDMLWPRRTNPDFLDALAQAKEGEGPNNISCIIRYSLEEGASILWMGDLESGFMESIKDSVRLKTASILFAPHHGRDSGNVPAEWLVAISPKIVVIGEAPSGDLNYYAGFNTITQNSAGDITFDCEAGRTHVYVSKPGYSVSFLDDEKMPDSHGNYIGTLKE
jgi:hypothetical protein